MRRFHRAFLLTALLGMIGASTAVAAIDLPDDKKPGAAAKVPSTQEAPKTKQSPTTQAARFAAATAQPLVPVELPRITNQQLLERAQKALRDIRYLSFDLEVTAPPSIFTRAEARMALGKLRTKFYVQNTSEEMFKEEKFVRELLIVDGVVTEVRYDCMGVDRIDATYRAPYFGKTHNVFLDIEIENYGCLTASALGSWVGAESRRYEHHLPMFIPPSQLKGGRLVDGKPCYAIRWERSTIARIDDMYFDASTYLLVRWDIFYTDLGPEPILSRTQQYKNINTKPLPESTWTLPPSEAVLARKRLACVQKVVPTQHNRKPSIPTTQSVRTTDATAQPSVPVELPRLTNQQLLERTQKALRDIRYLSFDLEVTEPPSIFTRAEARMSLGKLHTKFYVQNTDKEMFKKEKFVRELLIVDRVAMEVQYDCMGIDRIDATYRAPYVGKTHCDFLNTEIEHYGCLTASALGSWVGAESRRHEHFLPMFIPPSQCKGGRLVDGKPCYAIRWVRSTIDQFDDMYFDASTFLLVRWDTFYTDLGPKPVLSRTRQYKNISTKPLPKSTWTLPPSEAVQARKRLACVQKVAPPEQSRKPSTSTTQAVVLTDATAQPSIPVELPRLTNRQLLERTQKALRDIRYLSFDLEVTEPPSIFTRAEAKMSLGKLHTKFFVQNTDKEMFKEEKFVRELLIVDRVAMEVQYDCMGIDRIDATYRAPYVGGTYQTFLDTEIEHYGCLTASAQDTWVGAESRRHEHWLPRSIDGGEFRQSVLVDGSMCYAIRGPQVATWRFDDMYFDASTYLLVRWDTFYTDLGPKPVLSRTRQYKNISTKPLPKSTWTLPPNEAMQAVRNNQESKPSSPISLSSPAKQEATAQHGGRQSATQDDGKEGPIEKQ